MCVCVGVGGSVGEGVKGERELFSCYACVFIRFLRLLGCAHGLNYVILCYKHTYAQAHTHTQLRTLAQVQNRRRKRRSSRRRRLFIILNKFALLFDFIYIILYYYFPWLALVRLCYCFFLSLCFFLSDLDLLLLRVRLLPLPHGSKAQIVLKHKMKIEF